MRALSLARRALDLRICRFLWGSATDTRAQILEAHPDPLRDDARKQYATRLPLPAPDRTPGVSSGPGESPPGHNLDRKSEKYSAPRLFLLTRRGSKVVVCLATRRFE